ncbi:Protein argonaute 4 Protein OVEREXPRESSOR OF CATIONIC PEROXIDASE 11 [Vigna angularis]|uniref:Protein argonaute 4 Protein OVEREXPRESSOR OF CATIONIC PEROXIDASE 11 n=1 Tax=Phaseolus angularis TaxID=3914 RepID=A0A8T0KRR1_PHAAN|nr:Protein argonaute 4 Protein OVEREXPRESSOR OF CATIONIC PEROXIDASE 11 [Vigna angularis]
MKAHDTVNDPTVSEMEAEILMVSYLREKMKGFREKLEKRRARVSRMQSGSEWVLTWQGVINGDQSVGFNVVLEPEKKKVLGLPIARRGLGSKGRKFRLLTNHFKVNVGNTDGHFFQYSVSLSYEDGRPVEDVSTTMIVTPGPVVDFLISNQNVKDSFSLDWVKRKGGVDGDDTEEVTVYDYFVNRRKIDLFYSGDLPCINVGKPKRPTYIPLEIERLQLRRGAVDANTAACVVRSGPATKGGVEGIASSQVVPSLSRSAAGRSSESRRSVGCEVDQKEGFSALGMNVEYMDDVVFGLDLVM